MYEAFRLVLNVVEGKGQEEDDALCGGGDGDNGGDGVSGESSGLEHCNTLLALIYCSLLEQG